MDNRKALSDHVVEETRAVVASHWENIKADAEAHFRKVQGESADGDKLWSERTVRDGYNAKVMEWANAERRAKINANAMPRVFGAIIVPAQIQDATAWEARNPDRKVIDAVPAQAVQRGSGVAEVPGQLGSDVQEGDPK